MSSQPFSTRSTMTKRVSLLSKYLGVGLAVASLLAPVAHAATSAATGQATLLLSPDTGTFAVGEKVTMQVLLDTKGLEVSQVDFKLQYDPSYLEVQDSDLTKTGLQIKDGDLFEVLLSSSPVNTTTGMIQYSKLALSESKYYKTTATPGKVATIDFKALKAGSTELAFQTTDGVSTKVYRATDDSQVLGEVTNADITITAGGTSSATASATPTTTASPTASVTPSAVPTANRLTMALALNKNTLQADGNDKATLQATVKDQNGQPAANTKVVFGLTGNAVLGALSAMTNASGVASTTITAGTQAGNVTVSANLESDPTVSGSVQMTLAARPAATPSATARPSAAPMATSAPEVIAAPDQLNQVGPESTMALSMLVSMLLAALALTAPRLVKEMVRK